MPHRRARLVVSEPVPPAVSNTRLAMLIVICAECMLFAGLIGMYLVFRLAAQTWPPANLPRLPIGITAINTVLLFTSLVPLTRALHAVRRASALGIARRVWVTAGLGLTFLVIQGSEWLRLVQHGLTLGSGPYGSAFYVLIGCHAVHVLSAVLWLAAVAMLAARGSFTAARHAGLEMCTMYWYFVCGLWGVLFPLVYLY